MEKIVPADARLFFAFGVPKQEWDPSAEPYRFTVSLERRKSEILYEKELSPSAKKQDRRWQEVNLDLSKYGKQLVRFQFRFVSKKPQMISYLSQVKLTAGAFENVKPNVLLITIDTLRRDHVSAYGYNHQTTPAIDAFIKSSTVFTKGYSSAPLTVPSITSLMTSTYFSQHQVANNASAFDKTLPTLAEVLRNNGYSTAAFVGNAVLRPNRGLDAGFNVYNAYLPDSEINRRLPERNAQQLTDAALAWLGTHRQERFFLWLHYQDPHAPYTPPPPYNSMFLPSRPSAVQLTVVPNVTGDGGIPPYALLPGHFDPAYYVSQYDGEIRFADAGIQRILSALEESELRRNTIIVILADHGESLGENHFYFSHGHNVTPELIDVPLVISVPKKGFEKRTYPVQNVDVGPTVLRLLNLPVPPTFRGQVLFRTDSGRKAIAEQPNVRWAVYCERGLYIYDRTGSEEFQGSDSSMIPALRKTVQDLIANNLSNGILFAVFRRDDGWSKNSFRPAFSPGLSFLEARKKIESRLNPPPSR